jgi:uracil-DNA glycosylase family 4
MLCNRCGLSKTRINMVIGRGTLTASVLVIGEAPGKAEDVLGHAFIGESGKLLDSLLERAGIWATDCFYTNTVFCRPCDEPNGENREPKTEEIFLCLNNVLQTITCLKYLKGIIYAGKVSKKWYAARLRGLPSVSIIHPAALLRQGGTASPHYRDALNALKEFKYELR